MTDNETSDAAAPASASQLPPAGEAVDPSTPSSWVLWGKVAFVALSCATLVVVAYHMVMRSHAPLPIATIDLQAVIEAKELQFTDIVTRPGVTDADRERAYQLVSRLAGELETAVRELRRDCNCLVLVSAAVVGRADMDLTNVLRERMGVAEVNVAALREKLRPRLTNSAESSVRPQEFAGVRAPR